MCYRRERRKCVNAHACNMSLINCFCFPQNTLQFQYFLELWREFPHFSLTKQQDLYLEKIMLIFKQVKTKVSQKWLKGIVQPKTYSGSCYPKIHSFLHGRKNKIFIRMSKLLVFSIQWKHTAVVDIHFHYMETSSLDSAKYNYQTVKLWNVVLRCLILYCGLFRHHY